MSVNNKTITKELAGPIGMVKMADQLMLDQLKGVMFIFIMIFNYTMQFIISFIRFDFRILFNFRNYLKLYSIIIHFINLLQYCYLISIFIYLTGWICRNRITIYYNINF